MVELVVERRSLGRAFAIEHGQGTKGAGFVDVSAIAIFSALGDQPFALPQELGSTAIDSFGNAAAEGVVLVGGSASARQADADQAVLAVVLVFGDQFLTGAAAFAAEVAEGVVVVVTVALHQQAVTFDVGQVGGGLVTLAEQVAGRVVGEALWCGTPYVDQAIQRVVVITQVALAAVVDAGEVAVGVVGIGAAVEVVLLAVLLLADAVGLQAALIVVLVLAEQQALLALLFAAGVELVAGQARAVEVDAAELAARGMAVVEVAAIGQAAMAELAELVVFVAQGAPALVFGNQAVLQVVFVGQRPS